MTEVLFASRMWQVLLINLLVWTNFCPRSTTLAETILLGGVCWGWGFLSGAVFTLMIVSTLCRQLLWVLTTQCLRPPATPIPGDRLAGWLALLQLCSNHRARGGHCWPSPTRRGCWTLRSEISWPGALPRSALPVARSSGSLGLTQAQALRLFWLREFQASLTLAPSKMILPGQSTRQYVGPEG